MKLKYAAQALIDTDAAAAAIQVHSQQAAMRFLASVEETADNLLTFPEFGSVFESDDPELQGLRVCLVTGFKKHLLFYRIKGEHIVITRVLHGHRNLPEALKD